MIGEYKGIVKNKVVTALLQAYHDCLDYDGMKSILREAEMLHLKNLKEINPNETLDFFSFKKIITAQNCLLYECKQLLFNIGEKFSFYLFPFGKKFEEIVNEIDVLIKTDWKVEILEKTEESITLKIHNCIFCSEVGVSCDLFIGFLVFSLQKSLSSGKEVEPDVMPDCGYEPRHNNYVLTLKIKKKKP